MIVALRRPYPSRYGAPRIDRVDQSIFVRRYFAHCMACGFCRDWCCTSGVDVDIENVQRLRSHADGLEAFTGISRSEWFTDRLQHDPEFPGGWFTRTNVRDGRCVFLNKSGRGCLIHAFCVSNGIDYHELKPIVSTLFPVTFDDGLLHPSDEVEDGSLACLTDGLTLYRGVRDDLRHYFGDEFIEELDVMEGGSRDEGLGIRD